MAVEPHEKTRVQRVAVMPFGVYSGQGGLADITDFVGEGLARRGFAVVPQDRLEKFRIKHRIRRAEFMDRAVLRMLGVELDVDALVVGHTFMTGTDVPCATVAAQMVACSGSSVVWAQSISASGDDYATVLGLGRIGTMEELLPRIVEELLDTMPYEVAITASSAPAYEFARVGFQPDVLRGGQSTRLVVELKSGFEEGRRVLAFLLDKQIELTDEGNGRFAGVLVAPMIERSYPLSIYIADAWNKLVTVDTDAVLTVDNSPPPFSVHFSGALLSPNGDGVMDRILFTPEVGESLYIRDWSVLITNDSGVAKRSEEGRGPLPESFVWHGEDDMGHTVPDGEYLCALTVTDRAGNSAVTPEERVVVDTVPPDVAVYLVETAGTRMVALAPGPADDVARWRLILHERDGRRIAGFHGMGTPPATVLVSETAAAYSLEASDSAGNRQWVELSPLMPKKPVVREGDIESPKKKVWVDDF